LIIQLSFPIVEDFFFNYFTGPVVVNHLVAFFGSHAMSTTPSTLASDWHKYDESKGHLPSKNSRGRVDFRKERPSALINDRVFPGVYVISISTNRDRSVNPQDNLIICADYSTAVPSRLSTTLSSDTFAAFSDPSIDPTGTLVGFVASSKMGRIGVYKFDMMTRTLSVIADNTTPVPPLNIVTFFDFTEEPSIVDDKFVFNGDTLDFYSGGIFIATQSTSMNYSIQAIVTYSDTVLGYHPFVLGSAANCYDGQRVIFYATMEEAPNRTSHLPDNDHQLGIYSAILE